MAPVQVLVSQLGGAVQRVVDVLVEPDTGSNPVQVVKNDSCVEPLHIAGLADRSSRVQGPVIPERYPVVRGEVPADPDHLSRTEIVEETEQFRDVDPELDVDVEHDELFVRKDSETVKMENIPMFVEQGSHGLVLRTVGCGTRGPGFETSFFHMFVLS